MPDARSFFGPNARLLTPRFPALVARARSAPPPVVDESRHGEATMSLAGQSLHSRIDPVAEGKRKADGVDGGAGWILFLPADLLYAAESLLSRPFQRPPMLFFYWTDPAVFVALLHHRDLSFLEPHLERCFFLVEGWPQEGFSLPDLSQIRRTALVENPLLLRRDGGLCEAMRHRLFSDARESLGSGLTRFFFEKRWTLNLLRNLGLERPWVAWSPEPPARDRLAIVASAGPGLADAMGFLAANRDSYSLIATDTALRPLLLAGIVPDAVAALDGSYFNAMDFEIPAPDHVLLAADVSCHPLILRHWKGPVALFQSHPLGSVEPDLRERVLSGMGLALPKLATTGHITHTAMELAVALGHRRLGLVGLDLGYPFLESHAPSTCHGRFYLDRYTRTTPAVRQDFQVLLPRLHRRAPSDGGGEIWADALMENHAHSMENWGREPGLVLRRFIASGRKMELPPLREGDLAPGGQMTRPYVDKKSADRAYPSKITGAWRRLRSLLDHREALFEDRAGVDAWTRTAAGLPLIGPGLSFLSLSMKRRTGEDPVRQREVLLRECERFAAAVERLVAQDPASAGESGKR
ncbi:MAG: DUF115 domain-containing protein [Spirochaetes bacterium]|nr:DUF115 domain-containing protein [Spirochaetota bacterium]